MIRLFTTDIAYCAEAVARQVESGMVGPGKATERFEREFAAIIGKEMHCAATTSGTAALMLALLALDLRPGSTVLFPSYTMLAGANAARMLGHPVRLVDVDPGTACMDPERLKITPDVGAVIYVEHNGWCQDADRVYRKCRQAGVPMIEDAAQALGVPGAGLGGDIATFSFSPQKLITTSQGGAVVSADPKLIERVRQWADHGGGWRQDRVHRRIGGNFKFNDVAAALGLAQLERFDELVKRRCQIRTWYTQRIPVSAYEGWCVIFRANDPNLLIECLAQNGVEAARCYWPVKWNPPFHDGAIYPGAAQVYDEAVYLPSHLKITEADVDQVCEVIIDVDQRAKRFNESLRRVRT